MPNYMVHKLCRKSNIWTFILSLAKEYSSKIYKMSESNLRWAFNTKAWVPTERDLYTASSFIQPEEKQRINRYVFQNDAKSTLIGRLMMRKYIHICSSLPYDEIKFGREPRGRPILLGAGDTPLNFNVSHQGDYVVLAGRKGNVGIDIVKIEPPFNKNIPDFFRLMNRQMSPSEWRTIKQFPTLKEQMSCFYRIWCLKESYVKNIGVGITIPLDKISFSIKPLTLKVGEIVTETTLYIDGEGDQKDWVFEETLLDDKHAVAVSYKKSGPEPDTTVPYRFVTFEDLTEGAKPLMEPDEGFSVNFMRKERKTSIVNSFT